MVAVALVVGAAWACLLGCAYVCRAVAGFSKRRSFCVLGVAYAACAASALSWLGLTTAGVLGASGLLLPCGVAALLITALPLAKRPSEESRQ